MTINLLMKCSILEFLRSHIIETSLRSELYTIISCYTQDLGTCVCRDTVQCAFLCVRVCLKRIVHVGSNIGHDQLFPNLKINGGSILASLKYPIKYSIHNKTLKFALAQYVNFLCARSHLTAITIIIILQSTYNYYTPNRNSYDIIQLKLLSHLIRLTRIFLALVTNQTLIRIIVYTIGTSNVRNTPAVIAVLNIYMSPVFATPLPSIQVKHMQSRTKNISSVEEECPATVLKG